MIHAILLTHGGLGKSLIDSVGGMLGPQSDVSVLTNDGLSFDQIQGSVADKIIRPVIIFVDFCGGSPYMACQSLERDREVAIISGVNLPMLLSFFTKRDKLSFPELIETVKTDGLRGIQLLHSE